MALASLVFAILRVLLVERGGFGYEELTRFFDGPPQTWKPLQS